MGACFSSEDDSEGKKRSAAIDRTILEDARRLRRECKILLLGMDFALARRIAGLRMGC
jgi:guanine nucleotide-binding protein G(i) subunit alpha